MRRPGPDGAVVGLAAEMQAEFEELLLRGCRAACRTRRWTAAPRGRGRRVVPCRRRTIGTRSRRDERIRSGRRSDRYGEPLHVREDLRHHQRRRRAAVGGDGRRCGRLRLRSGSPRQIAAQVAYDITRRLPPEILTVGVFRDELPGPGRRAGPQVRRQGGAAARARDARAVHRGRQADPLGDQGVRRRRREPAPRPTSTAPT